MSGGVAGHLLENEKDGLDSGTICVATRQTLTREAAVWKKD